MSEEVDDLSILQRVDFDDQSPSLSPEDYIEQVIRRHMDQYARGEICP